MREIVVRDILFRHGRAQCRQNNQSDPLAAPHGGGALGMLALFLFVLTISAVKSYHYIGTGISADQHYSSERRR